MIIFALCITDHKAESGHLQPFYCEHFCWNFFLSGQKVVCTTYNQMVLAYL